MLALLTDSICTLVFFGLCGFFAGAGTIAAEDGRWMQVVLCGLVCVLTLGGGLWCFADLWEARRA